MLPQIFALEFMRRAFLVGLIVATVAPTIGLFFVVRRYSSLADTLAHVSFAGVAFSLLSGLAAIPTAFAASVLAVLGIEKLREQKVLNPDTIVSLFLFGGLASGVVMLGFAKGRNANVINFLFGNIVTVTDSDIISILLIGLLVLAVTAIFWNAFFAVALDEDTAEANGLPVKALNRTLSVLGAATIAISMNVAGVLLIGALMVIPVLAAMQFHVGFKQTWALALCGSVLSVLAGLVASYYFDLASGGAIVLVAIALFCLSSIINAVPKRSHA